MELEAGMAVPKYEDLQILEPEEEAGNSDNSEEVEEEICDVLERGAGETWDEEGGGHARQLDNTADTCNRDRHTVPGVQGSAPESSSNSTRTTIAREMEPSLHQAPPSPEPIVVTKAVHSAVWLENSTTREGLRKRTSDGSGTRLEEEGLQEAVPLSSLAQRVEDPASGPQRPPGPPYLFILIWMAIYCLIVLLHLDMDSLMQSVWS
ncbi:uncharacterized protein LOC103190525 [Callorhinchus milii]|uniref:uncharacterized protein LOC103190525 n=1 Tax=Callorhinchus milii TaxID=7868 RepID=UPI001C3FF5A4|nr:uncharacterized protein LOC103190525 [Callorhinchus milii]